MVPAPRSSLGLRPTYSTLDSTIFRRRMQMGGHMGDSPPLAHISGLDRRIWNPMQWPFGWVSYHAPAWDAGAGGSDFVPGFVC